MTQSLIQSALRFGCIRFVSVYPPLKNSNNSTIIITTAKGSTQSKQS